jgi:hypothetical protein
LEGGSKLGNIIPMEFRTQRIMTTEVLAESFGTDKRNISNNFNRNIERFKEGKHFYKLEGDELREFKGIHLNDESLKFVSILYLWTEKGAARHAKILDTDEAWQVYEELEETYFRGKEQKPACLEDVLIAQLQEMKALKQQLNQVNINALAAKAEAAEVKNEVQAIRDVVSINPNSWKAEINNLLNKLAKQRGGTSEAYREVRDESYKLLNERAAAKLEIRLTNRKRKVLEETGSKSKADKVTKLDVIGEDKRLTEVYIAIVKDMAIKYKVA